MRLNDPLVTSFSYKNKEYDIDLSFDTVLDVYDVLGRKDLRDYEKARLSLKLLLGEQEYDLFETIELWNYIYLNFIHVETKEIVKRDLLVKLYRYRNRTKRKSSILNRMQSTSTHRLDKHMALTFLKNTEKCTGKSF